MTDVYELKRVNLLVKELTGALEILRKDVEELRVEVVELSTRLDTP